MDKYKKIFKSRRMRRNILKILKFIPSKTMLKLQYRIKTGNKINFKNPKRYTEKIQLYKLYYRNPLMQKLVDKYEVRKYVSKLGLSHILLDNYGVYNKFEEIDFSKLPQQFVLKSTSGSGGNEVYLINNKNDYDFSVIKKAINRWPKKASYREGGREWSYNNIKTRILIEEMLPRDSNFDIPDYKFFCFDGKVEYIYTIIGRINDDSKSGKRSFFDKNFNNTKYHRQDIPKIDKEINKPANFDKMIEYAEILSKGFPHVRIDLYNIEGKIYFGEFTFYPASGYYNFNDDEFDFILGEKFDVSKFYNK